MPLEEMTEGGHGICLQEALAVLKHAVSVAMKPAMEPHKSFLPFVVFLSSCLLLSSGALLPKLHNSGRRLWNREAAQYPPPEGSIDLKAPLTPWGIRFPSITLHDWSLKWMSSDVTAPQDEDDKDEGENRKSHLWDAGRRKTLPVGREKAFQYPPSWMPGWDGKRSIVVADDAAFREKSKMLTAMERQKWLNSYMQKLLVVNSD